jgi:hypothetical protein
MIKNARCQLTPGVFLCLLLTGFPLHLIASPGKSDFHPFETRDQNLFNLIHGQALPTAARLLGKNQDLWSNSLIITNTVNIESSSNEAISLDYEAYRFNFSYQYGLNDRWNLKLDIPLMYQGGGVFDSAIDRWHEFFGLPRGSRPYVEDNQYQVQYSSAAQTLVDLDEADTSLGDIQIAIARSLITEDSTQLSLWAGLKLPTGDKNRLSGNGATDVSAWLALNQQLSPNWLINVNAGAVVPGENSYQQMELSDYALYGNVTLGWIVTDNVQLKLQLQGHTSYYENSQLEILGDTYFLTFGTTIAISQCQQLDFALNEDIKVDASPDASLLMNWRIYSSGCP